MQTQKPLPIQDVAPFLDGQRARTALGRSHLPVSEPRQAVVIVSDPDRPQPGPDPVLGATALPPARGDRREVPVPPGTTMKPIMNPALPHHVDRTLARPTRPSGTGLRLLLVDDDVGARRAVAEAIEATLGCSIHSVSSARDALDAVMAERFDAAILEVGLPDGDGCDLCAAIAARDTAMPIVMLSRFGREVDVVRGFAAGAHDYMVKPARPHELAARVRAHLRSFATGARTETRVGDQTYHFGRRTLSEPGRSRTVRLTIKEAALLTHLHRADGAAVSREELLDQVWGYRAGVQTHTVATHLYRLRCKIQPHRDSPRVLVHEPGGYRLLRTEAMPGTANAQARHSSPVGLPMFDAAGTARPAPHHQGTSLTV